MNLRIESLVLLLLMNSCKQETQVGPLPEQQEPWTVGSTLPYDPRFMFFDVAFPDPRHGWIVGGITAPGGGCIINTGYGAAPWSIQLLGTTWGLKGVFFVDSLYGWAVGAFGTVVRTADGGRHWETTQLTQGYSLDGVFFLNRDLGWVVGDNEYIFRSTSGGIDWQQQRFGKEFGLTSVAFIDSLHGWAVGAFFNCECGVVLQTRDGGNSWNQQMVTSDWVWTVKFFNQHFGWITGSGGRVYRTTDGGESWTLIQANTINTITSVAFVDSLHGWATGYLGTVLKTNDGGAHWEVTNPFGGGWSSRVLQSITFPDEHNGWIVGSDGFVAYLKR